MSDLSSLESAIREKAINAFEADLLKSHNDCIARHGAITDFNRNELFVAGRAKLLEHNRQRLGDSAVRQFQQTYERLLTEFPEMVAARDEMQ